MLLYGERDITITLDGTWAREQGGACRDGAILWRSSSRERERSTGRMKSRFARRLYFRPTAGFVRQVRISRYVACPGLLD